MNLQSNVDGLVRLIQLVVLAVLTFIIVLFVPLASTKFHYPGGLVAGLLILAIAAFIYSRRDTLRLTLRHDTGKFMFVAKNMWRTRVLEEGSTTFSPSVRIDKTTESIPGKYGRVTQDWYILTFKEMPSGPEKKTLAFGSLESARDAQRRIEKFFNARESDNIEIAGKEPMIGIYAYALLGICLCLFGPQ